MQLFDSHSHLNDEKFDEDRKNVIKEIKDSEVSKIITVGYDLESSKKAVQIAEKNDISYATCGISPESVPQTKEELWKTLIEIKEIAKNYKVKAIGEIGLDYYWTKENKEMQKEAFIRQIEIANELELPIVIHTREAINDTIQILKENNVKKIGIFHCCPQNRELIKEAIKLGFYISFAGPITFKNSKNADEMIKLVPNDRILIETDSPYLSPEPLRGRRNTPVNVKYIAKKIADVKQLTIEEIAEITYENTCNILEIKK